MKNILTHDLVAGMTTAAPVYSSQGQRLLDDQTVLTDAQIQHLTFYGIQNVLVQSEDVTSTQATDNSIQSTDSRPMTHFQNLRQSPEFKKFKKSYTEKVDFLEHSLNDVIIRNAPIDPNQLLAQINPLLNQHSTTLSLFDSMHNMRQIDDSTFAHSLNVGLISRMLGQWLGLPEKDLDTLMLAGLLHDIGKCMIDPAILQKPGKLTAKEYQEVKKHPALGWALLSKQDINMQIKLSAFMHHERSDGMGYPQGLKGQDTNYIAQIISISDVYDAMTADRCYRKGLSPFKVIETFETEGFDKYHPRYLLVFLEHIADSYLHNNVLLSDGRRGEVIFIPPQKLSRPVIRLADGTFLELSRHPELLIEAIL